MVMLDDGRLASDLTRPCRIFYPSSPWKTWTSLFTRWEQERFESGFACPAPDANPLGFARGGYVKTNSPRARG